VHILKYLALFTGGLLTVFTPYIWNTSSIHEYRLIPTFWLYGFSFFLVVLILSLILVKKSRKLGDKLISTACASIIILGIFFAMVFNAFSTQGGEVSQTYNCGDQKISIVKHFKEGADLYINHGVYLELITNGSTSGNSSLFPYNKVYPKYKSSISVEDKIKYAKCISELDIVEYQDKFDICQHYLCQKDGYKLDYYNLKKAPYPCLIKKTNGKVVDCANDYTPAKDNLDPNNVLYNCIYQDEKGQVIDRKESC
jgi:hypothetical protein